MSNEPTFPSRVDFASFLVYSPGGSSEVSLRSQRIMRRVKLDAAHFGSEHLAPGLKRSLPAGILERFFSDATTLVPIPRSAPLKNPDSRWAARELCEAFVAADLGSRVLPLLTRAHPVSKSAYSAPGERPTVRDHYDSFRATNDLAAGARIILIDDIITRGRTAFAAAARLNEALPEATVLVFAIVRTMGLRPEVERILDPCEGTLTWTGADVRRRP